MIKIQNINFDYEGKTVFEDASTEIGAGEFLFLVGESGIGKTTLLRLIHFDLFPKKGKIINEEYDSSNIDKNEIPFYRRKFGFVFQDFKLMNDRNVYENIAVPLYISGESSDIIKKRVLDISAKMGLLNYLKEMPYDLSGGEQQRVAIARAIINEPSVLLADEPTGNLDPFIARDIVKILININILGTTVIFATHNFEIVKRYQDKRIVQIKNKKLYDVKIKI